ncbi:response regulator transcription factor [Halobacillus sp. Marseille-P3879]|uniref:response regulator transcription factor n=1 Tax=Halobacillus sp. Marseille-P3879 TaxID=2045014 RepID=UPI000C79779F|nr:response regulator transcription factor [Halobacillus sp. Marseille-P3879]
MVSHFLSDDKYKKVLGFMDEISIINENFRKEVLLAFEHWFGFHQLNFWFCDENNQLYDPITLNTNQSITKDYLNNYMDMDHLVPHKLSQHWIPKRRVISLLDIQSKKEYENSEYYNSFMKKYGFYNNTGIFLVKNKNIIGLVDFVSEKNEKNEGIIDESEQMTLEILSRCIAQKLNDRFYTDNFENAFKNAEYNLTDREIEVLKLIRQGYSNKEIGENLFISVNTVKKHIRSLYQKFDVNNRSGLLFKLNSI